MSTNPDVSTDRRILKIPANVTVQASQIQSETNENPPSDATYVVGTSSLRWAEAHAINFFSERNAGDFFAATRLGWDNLNGVGALQMGPGGASAPDVYLARFAPNALSPIGSQITSLGDSNRWFNQVWATYIANKGTAVQAGSTTQVTDGSGNLTVTFPNAFFAPPTAITATVNGANYACRIVSKSTTQAVFRIFQPSVSFTTDLAVKTVATTTSTAVTGYSSTQGSLVTAVNGPWNFATNCPCTGTQNGELVTGLSASQFFLFGSPGVTGVVTGVSTSIGSFITNVFVGFNAGVVGTSITLDWIAVA